MGAMDIEATIRGYLPRVIHMSLATSRGNRPWVCEVHFVYDDDLNIYFRSLTTRRHSQEITENPHVAGNIVTQHHLNQKVRGVYFEGVAREMAGGIELEKAYPLFAKRLGMDKEIVEEAKRPDGHHFYQIIVSDYYLFDSYNAPSGKHHLPWRSRQ